jgi:hypothetical protein
MSSHLKLALRLKTPIGEPRVAALYLNIWSSIGGIGGTYWSSSPWVGTLFNGTVDDVDWWTPSKGIYIKNDTDGIVAVVRAISPWKNVGDTGAGRLYNGYSGTYPVPFDLDWECIATGTNAAKQMTTDQAQAEQETAVAITPFTRP